MARPPAWLLGPLSGGLGAWALACAPAVEAHVPTIDGVRVLAGEREVGVAEVLERAEQSAVVCIGEQHDDPKHHEVQRQILEALVAARGDKRLALGMEMFARPMQPLLDAFMHGDLDAAGLRTASEWDVRWGFGYPMYQPLLQLAHDQRVTLIALNAPRELTRAVARGGLESLPEPVRASLPELDLADAAHRRFFWSIMGFDGASPDHGGPAHGGTGSQERFYAAQVIWDETMAESAAAFLSEPGRQIAVIAGNGHCHEHAIPARVKRRQEVATLSLLLRSEGDELPAHVESDYVIEPLGARN